MPFFAFCSLFLKQDIEFLYIVFSDGGRSLWETVWRVCMERQRSQKPHPITPETPLQSRSGIFL
jgi:hypothetical protein